MTLTQRDLDEIENIVEEKIDAKTSNLPTKDEFFNQMDKVMGELQTIREEQTIIGHQLSNHENRLQKVESKLNISPN